MYRARLPSKPAAEVAYSISSIPAKVGSGHDASAPRLIVFLNNLLMPAASWTSAIAKLKEARGEPTSQDDATNIPILTYDRFGQGATTDRDPLDSRPDADPGYGHDFADVVVDLHALIKVLIPQFFPHHDPVPKIQDVSLLLIGASIGAPLARLYAQKYPHTVAGAILLDSNIANADYASFWPDPSAPDFDAADVVTPDCSLEQYIDATKKLTAMFAFDVKNGESLDRRSCPSLLPDADRPLLLAPGGDGAVTKVMVVGHDPDAFADEALMRMQTPKSFTLRWPQAAWERYNDGLLRVGDSSVFGGVRIARGCGHFIQKDDPAFVAQAACDMLEVLEW